MGPAQVPLEGFKALQGSGGVRKKFTIQRCSGGEEGRLPCAHTCINQVRRRPLRSAAGSLPVASRSEQHDIDSSDLHWEICTMSYRRRASAGASHNPPPADARRVAPVLRHPSTQLDLPEYQSKDMLAQRLHTAICEGAGSFGFI